METSVMEAEETDLTTLKQLSGRKKRKFFSKVKTQMEFYFSDSNLSKDKYLSDLIGQDPDGYVDLEVFKSFNRIKSLTSDINKIAAAISKSDILEVNEDNTRVRRSCLNIASKDFDACTLYVEKLPPYADQKWIKDVFEHFGVVEYINIPRFKISQKIKRFAFVEFSNAESVTKACEYYRNSNAKQIAESEEENIEAKQGDTKKVEVDGERNAKKRRSLDTNSSSKRVCDNSLTKSKDSKKIEAHIDNEKHQQLPQNNRKRKHENNEEDKSAKKPNLSKDVSSDFEETNKVDQEELENISAKGNSSAVEADMNSGDETPEKNKRKRKHKKKNHSQAEKPPLRVMSKREWKTYRNKFLDIQRATMSLLKKQLMLATREWREEHETNVKTESPKKSSIQFQPGIIIKVKLNDPIKNASDTKDQVKANAVVAYIDAPLGYSEMFVRCHTHDDAQSIINEGKFQNLGSVELLKGTEEEDYWKKIENDRKIRFSMPAAKKRGRDKILAKAAKLSELKNKHIYFDE